MKDALLPLDDEVEQLRRLLNETQLNLQERTRELHDARQQQEATAEVLKAISSSAVDLQAVLETLVASATRLCDADHAWLFRRDGEFFHWVAGYGHVADVHARLAQYFRPLDVPVDRGSVTGRAALEARVVQVSDVLADPDYAWSGAQQIGEYRSAMGVPLLRSNVVVGVIFIGRTRVQAFTDKQIELANTFADQAVIAIENARLFGEVQERTRELQVSLEHQTATSEVLKAISRSMVDLQPILDILVETATRLCRADRGLLFQLLDGRYRLRASVGHSPQYRAFIEANPISPDAIRTVVGRTATERRVVHYEDVTADERFSWPESQRLGDLRSCVGVPLLRDGEPIGVLALNRTRVEPFSPQETDLVTTFADQAVIAIENARLFEEVQARTRELQETLEYQTATSDVLNVISRAPSQLQPVFDTIVQTAARLCEAEYALVYTLQDGNYGVVATNSSDAEFVQYAIEHPLSPGRGSLIGRTALERRTVHLPDCLADPEYEVLEYQRVGKYRTTLGVPLLRDGVAIGVIALMRSVVKPFSEKQIELLTTFADQAVIAVENVRLFEEVQARTAELQQALEQQTATSEVLQAISRSTFDLDAVLETLVQSAARLCEADISTITRQKDGVYYRGALHGFPPDFAQRIRSVPVELTRGNVTGRTLLEGTVVHIEDVKTDPEYTWVEAQEAGQYRSLLGVPLLRQGTPIGAMALARRALRPFSESHIELVRTFADQAVIAIENVRLFDEVQARTAELARSVSELQALSDVSHAVNSTLELETVLDTIVTKAVQLSATDAGAIYVFSKLRQKFRLRATYGMSEAMIAEIGKRSIGLHESYIGAATQRGEAVQVPDLICEPASPMRDLVLASGYRGLLVAPLLRLDRIVGALVVRRKEPGQFPSSTIDLLQTFAAQSVLAIQNARLFEDVEARTRELAKSLEELRAAQERLIQTEKLASLGQLTAGIAHEIKNPLNFVNNFAALSIELIDELKDAIGSAQQDEEHTAELMELLASNLGKVVQHGKRADSIVKNMLLHSRAGSAERRVADINALVEESLNLAYHGARAEKQGFNVTIERSLDPTTGEVDVLPQEITRVLLNLISNGFYATVKRKQQATSPYEPILFAATRSLGDRVEIRIRDNGTGIPPEVKEKMFDPFFTTKPAGEGTGLGLSLSHDIVVKQHRGSIEVDTSPGEYTEFRIVLPRSVDGVGP